MRIFRETVLFYLFLLFNKRKEVIQMAEAIWNEASVKLMFLNGLKENGDPNYITKTFKNVKQAATPDQMLLVAEGLASLVTHSLYSVERSDTTEIIKS